jgi:hypothetical protein
MGYHLKRKYNGVINMGLHKFNKKRALRRLHFKQNKSKYIKITSLILSIIILITGIIYYTYSKFTISNKFNVIQTKVGDFSASGDYTIAAYIDGTKADNFPAKNDNYTFDKAECTNSATATWSTLNWNVIISNVTSSGTKCNVYLLLKKQHIQMDQVLMLQNFIKE